MKRRPARASGGGSYDPLMGVSAAYGKVVKNSNTIQKLLKGTKKPASKSKSKSTSKVDKPQFTPKHLEKPQFVPEGLEKPEFKPTAEKNKPEVKKTNKPKSKTSTNKPPRSSKMTPEDKAYMKAMRKDNPDYGKPPKPNPPVNLDALSSSSEPTFTPTAKPSGSRVKGSTKVK